MSTAPEHDTPEAAVPDLSRSLLPEPPRTEDARVDAILAEFVEQSTDSDDLSRRIEGVANAHRQLQARLSADREH